LTLSELADRLGCRLEGDGDIIVRRVTGLDEAAQGDVSFFANKKYASSLASTKASAVILAIDGPAAPCATLRTPDPYLAFANAVAALAPDDRPPAGVSPHAVVASDAHLGDGVSVGPFASIGARAVIGARTVIHPSAAIYPDAVIGEDCVIHAHVSIRERCRLGCRVVVQNGAVVGSDGFGFAPRPDGTYQKIPQIAPVVVEDDVEIGANSTIDRPAVGQTLIESGTKIDNLVMIAHGVHVGRNVMLVSQVGIAGSTTIGDSVILAGQVGVAGHLEIGKGTKATAQSGIPNSVAPGSFISGYPAIENRDWLKSSAVFRRLPELKKAVADLERRLAAVEAGPKSEPTDQS